MPADIDSTWRAVSRQAGAGPQAPGQLPGAHSARSASMSVIASCTGCRCWWAGQCLSWFFRRIGQAGRPVCRSKAGWSRTSASGFGAGARQPAGRMAEGRRADWPCSRNGGDNWLGIVIRRYLRDGNEAAGRYRGAGRQVVPGQEVRPLGFQLWRRRSTPGPAAADPRAPGELLRHPALRFVFASASRWNMPATGRRAGPLALVEQTTDYELARYRRCSAPIGCRPRRKAGLLAADGGLGRKTLITASLVSAYGPPMRSMQ